VIEPKNDIGADRKRRYRNTLENTFCKASVPDLDRLNWGSLRLADFKGKEWIQRYHNTLYAIERAGTMTGDKRGRCTLGNETDQFMQLVFDYAIELEYLAPAHRPKRNKSVRRPRAKTRYLTVAEIEHLLALTTPAAVEASAVMNELDACYLRVLLFTGTRLNSVRLAVRSNMHLRAKDFWTFPSEDLKETKTQREVAYDHHIPLTEPLRRELARLDAIPGVTAVDPFFPERYFKKRAPEAVKPVSNSWAKHLLGDLAEALGNDGADAYSGHAFRRTQSNLMRELGVPDHVINLCQARVARDTAKTYLTAELRDQVHNAFDVYHDFLEACTHGKGEEYLQYIRDQRRSGYLKERAARRDAIGLDRLGLVKGGAR
jgi:integrase